MSPSSGAEAAAPAASPEGGPIGGTLPGDDWLHFLRSRDLTQILSGTPEPLKGPVLEIGCGDGFISGLLRERFGDDVFPTDVRPRSRVPGVTVSDVRALPFPDGYFRFIFSSNVLEHIDPVEDALGELRRVSAPGAVMIHTMPTPFWKLLQLALYPLHLVVNILPGKLSRRRARSRGAPETAAARSSTRTPRGGRWRRLLPPIHGVARSHLEEARRFRPAWWERTFARGGYHVYRRRPLYLHSAYRLAPYRFLRVRRWLARMGLASVVAYWVRAAPADR